MTTLWPPAMEPRAETLAASRPAALDGQSGSGVDATLCIALVVERFQPARGGLEHWAWQFACWLRDGGHSVHIITFAVDGAVERSGFRVHRLSSPATPLARADAVARFLTGTRFDIVHDTGLGWCADVFQPHGGSRFADFEQSQRARSPAARLGFLLRPSTHRRMAEYRELARRRLGRPALVLALSARVRDDLRRHDRLPEQQIRVLPNGVDHDRYRRDTSARDRVRHDLGLEDATVFLLLAHNSRLKGLPTALRALAATPAERRAQLLVIGRGESSAYSRLATNLGIAQRVHFIGAVDDPRPYLSCADIYLHPTLYDPCSLATLEALACELPVITTRNNGVSELMNHGREGLILEDPLDHQQLARLMLELCDSRRRAAMGRAARRLALHHSCARSFSAVFDVYRDILEDRQRKRHSSCVAP